MSNEEMIYNTGDAFFDDLCAAIISAKKTIHFETYIFDQDTLGKKILTLLADAAKRGVQVRLLLDGIGSVGWTFSDAELWRKQGIDLRFFHPLPWQNHLSVLWRSLTLKRMAAGLFKLNRRNHRKICIVDTCLTFITSMNVSERHLKRQHGPLAWRDTAVKIKSAALSSHLNSCDTAWEISHRHHELRWREISRQKKNTYADLLKQLKAATQKIWITTPYFVPDFNMTRALCAAARAGIDVRILLPAHPDVLGIKFAMQAFYGILLRFGVAIHEYSPSMLHAKVFIIDDWVRVGSSNLDYRSIFSNLEANTVLTKKENIRLIQNQFLTDLRASERINFLNWKNRSFVKRTLEGFFLIFKKML